MRKDAASKRGLPMPGCRDNQHDVLARFDPAVAMDRRQSADGPALRRLPGDPDNLGLGHAGIVFEFERLKRARLIAAKSGEGDDGADVGPSRRKPLDLGCDIEVLALHADGWLD